jgi:hypothetical protein
MKKYLEFSKRLFLVTPLLATVFAVSPSRAATFASSEANFTFTNFSQRASGVSADVQSDTLTVEQGGTVKALAKPQAFFLQSPLRGINSSLSIAFGENRDYLGEAKSEATLIGFFDVDENTPFSFDFAGNLKLSTSIDNPPIENARASGDIAFALFDTTNNNILDFFSLAGNLETEGNDDFISYQQSDNINLKNPVTESSFGGQQEFATAAVEGSFKYTFANKTNLSLIEVKRNQVRVTAPEPSTGIALLLSCSFVGVVRKRKR